MILILAVMLAFSLAQGAPAMEKRSGAEGVTFHFDPALRGLAEKLESGYPSIKSDVEKKVGWRFRTVPSIYLLDSEQGFEKMGGDPAIAAFALIGRGRIVMNLSSFEQVLMSERTLRHELCHVLLHDHMSRRLPDWLEEGICEWASRPAPSAVSALEAPFRAFDMHARAIPLSRLGRFKGTDLGLAYGQSGAFISYTAEKYGDSSVRKLLDALRKGAKIDKAFEIAFTKTLPAMEAEWRSDLAHRARWFILPWKHANEAARALNGAFHYVFPRYRAELLCVLAFLIMARLVHRRSRVSGQETRNL